MGGRSDLRGKQVVKFARADMCACKVDEPPPNNAIKPTPEQALRSNRAVLPARLIATLGLLRTIENWRMAE